MATSVNFWLAAALTLAAILVLAFGDWLRKHSPCFDRLRDASVASALLLVPVNLVFSYTNADGLFSTIVVIASLAAIGVQFALLYRRPAPPTEVAAPTPVDEEVARRLRVLAIATDSPSLEREAGTMLGDLTLAGHEIYALVMGDASHENVTPARRTILVGLPHQILHELDTQMEMTAVEHAHRLMPDLILAPAPDGGVTAATALHRAIRRGIDDQRVLLYTPMASSADAADDEPTQDMSHLPFQRRVDDEEVDGGRVTMPSFGGPWA